jgi:hypothetical protein
MDCFDVLRDFTQSGHGYLKVTEVVELLFSSVSPVTYYLLITLLYDVI